MARKNGKPAFDLKKELLAQGEQFSFFQALRLLERENVQVRPDTSLAFPKADIKSIEELPAGKGYLITSTFLGLYGAASPLPAFYSEDILADAREDSTAARDFLDIIHRRLYTLLFECWKKYRSPAHVGMLHALSGQNHYSFLRYTGLFGGHPRSALGLKTMLTDFLSGTKVEIVPCMPRPVKIAADQRLKLGAEENGLGENSILGEELIDYQSKFRVRIGPLDQQQFSSVLPGGEKYKPLTQLIDNYLLDPLVYDFELVLAEEQIQHATLGGPEWSRLGLDTVVFTAEPEGDLNVVYPSAN